MQVLIQQIWGRARESASNKLPAKGSAAGLRTTLGEALCNRILCNDGDILFLHCPVWYPLAMWLLSS